MCGAIFFTLMSQFRAPIEPFLIVFAAAPLAALWRFGRREATVVTSS